MEPLDVTSDGEGLKQNDSLFDSGGLKGLI